MKKTILNLILCFILASCSNTGSNYLVRFCNQTEGQECIEPDSVFDFNKTVYVQFISEWEIPFDTIHGKIYGLLPGESERFMFATRPFIIEPGQTRVDHSIPFGQFGSIWRYEIEFVDEQGDPIALGKMRIRRPEESPAP